MWKFYAVGSAFFAALTALLAKKGVAGVDSNLATAIRTTVVLALAWGIALWGGAAGKLRELNRENLVFLILSGLATGASWLLYFKALQIGDVSKVAPIDKLSVVLTIVLGILVLGEPADPKTLAGGALIAAGTLVILS